MGMHVHRAERTDLLADELAAVLRAAPPDQFTRDVVAVPTKGVERFLAQRLALVLGTASGRQDGVCANVAFPAPDDVVAEVLALGTSAPGSTGPADPGRRLDPWRPDALRWTVLTQLDACLDEDWAAPLRRFLVDPNAGAGQPWRGNGRLIALAERVAAGFGTYDRERPGLVQAWAAGADWDGSGPEVRSPVGELPEDVRDLAWQPALWRRVRASTGLPSPAERLPAMCAALAADPGNSDLPQRLSVFGPTRLPLLHLQVLAALAEHRDVHLWLPDPSPGRWERLLVPTPHPGPEPTTSVPEPVEAPIPEPTTSVPEPVEPPIPEPTTSVPQPVEAPAKRHSDPSTSSGIARFQQRHVVADGQIGSGIGTTEPLPDGHPLLRSLGRDSAELADRLAAHEPAQHTVASPPARPATLLGWLQEDLSRDQVPTADERRDRVVRPGDRSVQVHACHGRQRQVEVLREVLLGLLQADPALQPRDILVMCPDVETFAPLVSAAFNVGTSRLHTPAHDLRVRVADRTPEQENPVLAALDALFGLVAGRMTAHEVLDYAALEPVARKFGLDAETLDRLQDLVEAAGVRWGLGPADHARFGVEADQNTWRHGLDRLLAGVTMSEDGLHQLGGVLPLDDVADQDVTPLGRLAELVDALAEWAPVLRQPRPAREWLATLSAVVTELTAAPVFEGHWQHSSALGALNRVLGPAADCGVVLEFGDVRVLLAGLLAGRPTRTNFRTGGVTVCSLVPMRSVPHKVVCLLGVDDGVYPRPRVIDGNDLVARTRRPGERDRTSEDRQVLLDAINAATQTLVIVHTGFDEHTNEPLPAAVPVQELLDALDDTATSPAGDPPSRTAVVRHPLQPFDARNFLADELVPGVFSHDVAAFDGARAALSVREPAPALVTRTLEPPAVTEVQLADLASFLRDPPGFFLRQRLGLRLRQDDEEKSDELPVDLSGLAQWQVGDRLVCGLRDGAGDVDALLAAEVARGALPPGRLGSAAREELRAEATSVMDRASRYLNRDRHEVPVAIDLADGVRVVGTVAGVQGRGITTVQFGAVRDKQVADLWLRVLALGAAWGDSTCGGVVVGREHSREPLIGKFGVRLLLDGRDPREHLAQLVDLMRRGLADPLPLTPRSSALYAQERPGVAEDIPIGKVRWRFWGTYGKGECDAREASIAAVWGADDPFTAMLSLAPRPDEQEWYADDSTRFGVLSRRLWDPIVAAREWLQ